MKVTTVPAQVTTVEDRIAGNLNFTQLFIISLPVFIGGALYIVLPPFVSMPLYKTVLSSIVLIVCLSLALRVRGTLVLHWIGIKYRYNTRPRYYILNKNDTYLRETASKEQHTENAEPVNEEKPVTKRPVLHIAERVRLEGLLTHPHARARFEVSKRGGLRVRITEVKQES